MASRCNPPLLYKEMVGRVALVETSPQALNHALKKWFYFLISLKKLSISLPKEILYKITGMIANQDRDFLIALSSILLNYNNLHPEARKLLKVYFTNHQRGKLRELLTQCNQFPSVTIGGFNGPDEEKLAWENEIMAFNKQVEVKLETMYHKLNLE